MPSNSDTKTPECASSIRIAEQAELRLWTAVYVARFIETLPKEGDTERSNKAALAAWQAVSQMRLDFEIREAGS